MSSVNKIVMIGNLTADPVGRVTTEGTSVTNFTLIIQRGGASQDKTDLIPIVCWGKLADQAAESFKNGMMVVVEGRIQNRSFDDKEGQKIYTTEVVASYARLLDGSAVPVVAKAAAADDAEPYAEDDIPF
jgi:single-strand DNA-binding protein